MLGLGDTGLSMARWLARLGAKVQVADTRSDPPHAETLVRELPHVALTRGAFREGDLARAEAIAVSPGIDPREPAIANAVKRGVPVVGDIELFAQALAEREQRPRVLAVTGSNGKSTVTAMVGAMCREAGIDTVVAGNIGPPVLDALRGADDGARAPGVFVLEISSFQLETTTSLEPDAATMLNLCEDHMDRYRGLDEYAAAKARIFAGDGVQVLNRDDPWSMRMARAKRHVVSFGAGEPRAGDEWGITVTDGRRYLAQGARGVMQAEDLPLAGLHNAMNALAALALVRALDLPEAPLLAALRAFKGLPHRVQKVTEIEGVTFYDDSKGTNVGATVAALSGMSCPVVLIAGGDGKGQDFSPLAAPAAARARAVVLIGRDAPAIAEALRNCGVPIVRAHDMAEAVRQAHRVSRAGDAVLLSPACASFDMFRNYVHRGEAFVAAVRDFEQCGA